jgi:NAD(P)-dependent dehydrogenase (short-subunit alcohol dehydrogenase family)
MKNFEGKVVVITGSSMGIGKAIAEKLAAKGARLVLNSRGETLLEAVRKDFASRGHEVLAVPADVANLEDCKKIVDAAIQRFGRIDYLINNAGVNMRGRVEDILPEALRIVMDVNYNGALFMTRLCLPHLKASRGGVLFISSLAGIHGLPLHTPYSAAKMALRALAEGLRAELFGTGVYVGITYVGLTQNEPGKTIYNGVGERIPKEDVSVFGLQPIPEVAEGIVRMISQRKFQHTFTFLGKLHALLNRISPELVQYILTRAFLKKGW